MELSDKNLRTLFPSDGTINWHICHKYVLHTVSDYQRMRKIKTLANLKAYCGNDNRVFIENIKSSDDLRPLIKKHIRKQRLDNLMSSI